MSKEESYFNKDNTMKLMNFHYSRVEHKGIYDGMSILLFESIKEIVGDSPILKYFQDKDVDNFRIGYKLLKQKIDDK
jgi:hypothetical protein